MKFDKFVKAIGSDGTIFTDQGEKWLCGLGCALKIPETKNVCSTDEIKIPEWFLDILTMSELVPAELNDCVLPRKDSKTSELLRVFDEAGKERGDSYIPVAIHNKSFGFIEKSDVCYVCHYDRKVEQEDGSSEVEIKNALVICNTMWDVDDDHDIIGVMFNIEINEEDK